jgi:selenocysteine-specific elongation factor
MRHIIVGTAGHIDHGKSALIRALTGIEPDRWEEERRRGISIDLGFAHLTLPDGTRVAFIDVPGHERFVRNMLAGVGGIDLVMLVIAADESIKPQTREHFAICRLLGIQRGIIVITKSDLVEPEILDLVKLAAEEFVAGSFLEDAPLVTVSSVTGEGLDRLTQILSDTARSIPPRGAGSHLRLPIDRAFSMKGFGTVITGTLCSGSIRVDQDVEIHRSAGPSGARARVRGLQVHGESVAKAVAGQRTAVNLAGIEVASLARGMTLGAPGILSATRLLDCRLDLLPDARPLKHNAPVHFHAWTAETEAKVRLLEPPGPLEPGASAWARLTLSDPVLLLPGDRFIIRMFSPVVTIGGGTVVDINPPVRLRRAAAAARAERLHQADESGRVSTFVSESKWGVGLQALVARTGLTEPRIQRVGPEILVFREPETWFISRARAAGMIQGITKRLAEFHKAHPLLAGAGKQEIRSREMPGAPAFLLDALLAQTTQIAADGDLIRLAGHKPHLKKDEEEALARIESAFEAGGMTVPSTSEVLSSCGIEAARAKTLLQMLFRQRRLIRLSDELVYHPSAMAVLRQLLAARKGTRFGVGEFKDWTGVSRKYAIPLLEYLDRQRVTRRDGDERVII